MIGNPTRCCSVRCNPASNAVTLQIPTPGTTIGNTTPASNTAVITFSRNQKLVSFRMWSKTTGATIEGTITQSIGAVGTSFTFTPASTLPLGEVTAFIITEDILKGCIWNTQWSWTVST